MEQSRVLVYIHPRGMMPRQGTELAAGFDIGARAVVSRTERDPDKIFRRTLFDFRRYPVDPEVRRHVCHGILPSGKTEPVYRLRPGEKVMVGSGFITEMPEWLCYLLLPRSGNTSIHEIKMLNAFQVFNAFTMVDPDYRGEAGVLLYNQSRKPFDIFHNMKVAQIVFLPAMIPILVPDSRSRFLAREKKKRPSVIAPALKFRQASPGGARVTSIPLVIPQLVVAGSYRNLSRTGRGARGFGSTGL